MSKSMLSTVLIVMAMLFLIGASVKPESRAVFIAVGIVCFVAGESIKHEKAPPVP
jgi:1,4-dihydroxy-2-naphthoate octaprenyltransferase